MTNSELTSHFRRAGMPPRINWRRLGTGDLIWATFPRPHAATPAPISNPFGTHALVARSGGADCDRGADRRIANDKARIVMLLGQDLYTSTRA
jgi:hypothetical protein